MSLLQSIVQELDAEFNQLQALRKIVAGLTRTPALVTRYTEPAAKTTAKSKVPNPGSTVAEPLAETVPEPPRKPSAARRRVPEVPKPAVEDRALARKVPNGPVVFYLGRSLQGQAIKAAAPRPQQNSGPALDLTRVDLDAQSRELAAQWGARPIL